MARQLLLHDDFFASVTSNDEGIINVIITDYGTSEGSESVDEKGLYVNIKNFEKFKENFKEIENFIFPLMDEKQKRKREEDSDTQELRKNKKKGKKEPKKPKTTSNYMRKKPSHLKLKIKPQKILCDEVEMKEKEKEVEEKLFNIYAEEVQEQLALLIKEKCFGCVFDKPSQKDHDVCCGTPYTEVVEQYLGEIISKVNMDKVLQMWYDFIEKMDIPSQTLERMKFNCPDQLMSSLGIEKVKNIISLDM